MGVSEENVGIQNIPFLQHDLLAQSPNTSTRINDDSTRTTSYLKAGGVSAIFDGIRTRASNASPGSPELEPKGSAIGHVNLRVLRNVVFFLLVGNPEYNSLQEKNIEQIRTRTQGNTKDFSKRACRFEKRIDSLSPKMLVPFKRQIRFRFRKDFSNQRVDGKEESARIKRSKNFHRKKKGGHSTLSRH